MTQASQRSFDGKRLVYRWYVTVNRPKARTIITWAETAEQARAKVETRGLVVVSVKPAISRLDEE